GGVALLDRGGRPRGIRAPGEQRGARLQVEDVGAAVRADVAHLAGELGLQRARRERERARRPAQRAEQGDDGRRTAHRGHFDTRAGRKFRPRLRSVDNVVPLKGAKPKGTAAPRRRRRRSKTALVLGGGGFTGAVYEIGALRALD